MFFTSLQLKDFRSYEDFSVEFSDAVNIVVGPNASGKTNLLEALLVASRGSSFRANDRNLIKHGKDALKITTLTNTGQKRTIHIKEVGPDRTSKEFRIDDVVQKRLSPQKTIPTVLFEPEHMRMIHGSPELRREYLDGILSVIQPEYKGNLNRYKKALAQRNRLLKQEAQVSRDDVFVWDVQLSRYGEKIHTARQGLVENLNNKMATVYSYVSGKKTELVAVYDPGGRSEDYATRLLKTYHERFEIDRARGFTTRGPHREDIQFLLAGKDASEAASRGESRTIVLVCKIIELSIIEDFLDKKPIVLLDDVFSELDGARRLALTKYLKSHQTIITTTDADAIVKSFLEGYNVIATG